jgi:hypothetical protein
MLLTSKIAKKVEWHNVNILTNKDYHVVNEQNREEGQVSYSPDNPLPSCGRHRNSVVSYSPDNPLPSCGRRVEIALGEPKKLSEDFTNSSPVHSASIC